MQPTLGLSESSMRAPGLPEAKLREEVSGEDGNTAETAAVVSSSGPEPCVPMTMVATAIW
jgi:hypothetical protein